MCAWCLFRMLEGCQRNLQELVKDMILGPPQGTPVYRRCRQCQVGMFAIATEVDTMLVGMRNKTK
jgi:hypothetical protein